MGSAPLGHGREVPVCHLLVSTVGRRSRWRDEGWGVYRRRRVVGGRDGELCASVRDGGGIMGSDPGRRLL